MKAHVGYLSLFLLIVALALSPLLVLASDVSTATYQGRIEVRKNNSLIRNATVNFTLDPDNLINPGYAWANFTNTAVRGSDGADVVYMPAPDGTTHWMLFVPEVAENTTINQRLYTGGATPMGGEIRWFPGDWGNSTTSDAADLEPGGNFTIAIRGWIDADAEPDWQNLTAKPGTFFLRTQNTDGELFFSVAGSPGYSMECDNLTTGLHTINATCDASGLATLWVDGIPVDANAGSANILDVAADWEWADPDVIPYVEWITLVVDDVTVLHYDFTEYQADSSVTDEGAAPANTGTIAFADATSDADLSATFVSFEPVSTSQASAAVVGADAEMWAAVPAAIPELYTELQTNHLPGAGFVNDMLGHADIPQALFWIPAAILMAILGLFLSYMATKSLVMALIVGGFLLAFQSFMTGGGIIPAWIVILYIIFAIALAWTLRQRAVP